MGYVRTHTFSFRDNHPTSPIDWRYDILDDQGSPDTVVYPIMAAGNAVNMAKSLSSDDKSDVIIGDELTLNYKYNNPPDIHPELFFNADERRFKIEVYRNNNLYKVFFARPDSGNYADTYIPIAASVKAVDGFAFLEGTKWNCYDSGRLKYGWLSLYEVLITRGLFQVFDPVEVDVISSLRPSNIGGTHSFLNDLYVHTDAFYDYTTGPISCKDVITRILSALNCRIFMDNNKIYIVRVPDMLNANSVERYDTTGAVTTETRYFARTIGPAINGYDGTPVQNVPNVLMFAALKQAKFALTYKAINQILNFQWVDWDGVNFANWTTSGSTSRNRVGSGTQLDPYRLSLIAPQTYPNAYLGQNIDVEIGDMLEIAFNVDFYNCNTFWIQVIIAGKNNFQAHYFLSSGTQWLPTDGSVDYGTANAYIRSGDKNRLSVSVLTQPIPAPNHYTPDTAYQAQITIRPASQAVPYPGDAAHANAIEIYPIKIGRISTTKKGINITVENPGRYSKVLESRELFFADTGVHNVSNNIAVDVNGAPAKNWQIPSSVKTDSTLQRWHADTIIEQYQAPVKGWEGIICANTTDFSNIFVFNNDSTRQFIAMAMNQLTYDSQQTIRVQQINPQNVLATTYSVTDQE